MERPVLGPSGIPRSAGSEERGREKGPVAIPIQQKQPCSMFLLPVCAAAHWSFYHLLGHFQYDTSHFSKYNVLMIFILRGDKMLEMRK